MFTYSQYVNIYTIINSNSKALDHEKAILSTVRNVDEK